MLKANKIKIAFLIFTLLLLWLISASVQNIKIKDEQLNKLKTKSEQLEKRKLDLEKENSQLPEIKKQLEETNKQIEALKVSKANKKTIIASAHAEAPKTPSAPLKTVSTATGNLAQWLLTLRNCESGGNYQINTGNGYYGAYQFSLATWNHWNTGYARADLAPPSVQDATIIKNTNASAGLMTQNPGCYSKFHLSNKPPVQ